MPWQAFWRELQPGWEAFEATRVPPAVAVRDGHYRITAKDTP